MLEARLYRVDQVMAAPFGHAALTRTCADSVVLVLESGSLRGMGECAPRSYVTGESAQEVLAAAAQVDPARIEARIADVPPRRFVRHLMEQGVANYLDLPQGNNLACLFELAILDLLSQREQCSVAALVADALDWPAPPNETVEVPFTHVFDFSKGMPHPGDGSAGAKAIKLKADADIGRTVAMARAVRDSVGASPLLIVDANMSWSVETALHHATALSGLGVDFYEEPIARGDFAGMAMLRKEGGMSLMLDESLCSEDDARRAARSRACDAFNIRVAKCGGLLGAIRLASFAREHGIGYQIGVQVAEVGPLIQAERQLALLCPDFLTMESGQHDRFFHDMVIAPVPAIDRPRHRIAIHPAIGLGVQPTPLLDRFFFSRRS